MENARTSLIGLIVGGFFIVLPMLLVGLVIEKIYHTLETVVYPMLESLPSEFFHNPLIRGLVIIIAVVALLLLVGLLARTRAGQAIGHRVEAGILNRLPFYAMLRNIASGLAGKEDEKSLRPVMVMVQPELQQLGLLVERHADGSGTVFFPFSPNPGSGTVLIVEALLIRELHIPAHRIFNCLSSWGYGATAVLAPPAVNKSQDKS
jgi:uncharacterized membrane protein